VCFLPSSFLILNLKVPLPVISNPSLIPSTCPLSLLRRRSLNRWVFLGHASRCVAVDPDWIGVRVESDQWGRGLKHRLTLKGQMGVVPGGRTGETSEKDFDVTTNLVGGEERRKKVSLYGCSTGLVFGLIISHRNFVFLDSCAANGVRFPPETPRSQRDDHLRQGLGRVGKMEEYHDEGW
jgi:hypothetical protein